MKAITVSNWGDAPSYTANAPNLPAPGDGEVQLRVLASGLHRLVRSQALGTHYSARNTPLPYTPGSDGVGLTPDGKKAAGLIELSSGADPVQVAGLVNPGMSSWMALKARVQGLDRSRAWNCVILGVATQSGKVAVEFARMLGAARIVGVARDADKMKALRGLDETIVLKDTASETDFEQMGDVDVILDYLYGAPFAACISKLNSKVPTQAVQIGIMAGMESNLPSAMLRSKDLTMRGSGPGAWTMEAFAAEAEGLVRAVEKLSRQAIVERELEEVLQGWENERERTVFVPGR